MKKVTVIVGEACSGKSRLAMELVKEFDPSEIVLVDGKNLKKTDQRNLMNFLNISKNNKVIIADDTTLDTIPFLLFNVMFPQSTDKPEKMIIVCNEKITRKYFPQEFSASSSVEIIDTKDYYTDSIN